MLPIEDIPDICPTINEYGETRYYFHGDRYDGPEPPSLKIFYCAACDSFVTEGHFRRTDGDRHSAEAHAARYQRNVDRWGRRLSDGWWNGARVYYRPADAENIVCG